jgi:predicted dehydrogenase
MVLRVGVVGCGNISDIYIRNARRFPGIEVVACSSRRNESTRAKAALYELRAMEVADLIRSDDIDVVLNLTIPEVHADISLAAIAAGKHVYSEKPLGITVAEGAAILAAAATTGVRVGCAPDTFFGPGVQLSRRLIDEGRTGEIVGGVSAVLSHGMEHWHPNPEFYYRRGGGPVLDLGPYHITALVALLGPVASVKASGRIGAATRTITADGPTKGRTFRPEVLTTVNALLRFASGAEIVFLASWDVRNHGLRPIELYGASGSLRVPDPDFFGGAVETSSGDAWEVLDTATMPLGAINYADPAEKSGRPTLANYRGVGLADMASGIVTGRPHRASGGLALHVLAVMEGILAAADTGGSIDIAIPAERPEAFGAADLAALEAGPASG